MPDQYVGEIRLFPYDRIPENWAPCDGQLLQIGHYQALFSLLGTTFGGNGKTDFGLPDMKGRVAIGTGATYQLGGKGGAATHALTQAEMPMHTHQMNVSASKGVADSPVGNVLATAPVNVYNQSSRGVTPLKSALGVAGKGEPHQNMQPYQTLCYCIALTGIYPERY